MESKGVNVEEHHLQYDPTLAVDVVEKAAGILVPKNGGSIHELPETSHASFK